MGVNGTMYVQNTLMYLEIWDVLTGLIKAAVFGVVIAIVGCWQGMETEGGAEGVGRATTRTVVISSISILILNFFISKVLPGHQARHDPHHRSPQVLRAKEVLRGVNLTIEKGETMVVIGQSGSGKSVLLKHLIGLLKPDSGEIFIDDVEITGLDEDELQRVTRKFGMLFQGAALFDSMTVAENVALRPGAIHASCTRGGNLSERSAESLARSGSRGVECLMPYELSGGMKKRVGLARAIAYRPEIMLYDEPSTGIDPIRADAINDLINKLKNELRVTSVVITHDMVSAYKIADRIAMLYDGRDHRGRDTRQRSGIRRARSSSNLSTGRPRGRSRIGSSEVIRCDAKSRSEFSWPGRS